MPRDNFVVRTKGGQAVSDALVTVCSQGTQNPISLYEDDAMLVPKDNPFYSDSSGNASYVAAQGTYDIHIEKAGVIGDHWERGRNCGADQSAGQQWVKEVPAGALNGVNKAYTLTYAPSPGTVEWFVNGISQNETDDLADPAPDGFVMSGSTLTLTNDHTALNSADGDKHYVRYLKA